MIGQSVCKRRILACLDDLLPRSRQPRPFNDTTRNHQRSNARSESKRRGIFDFLHHPSVAERCRCRRLCGKRNEARNAPNEIQGGADVTTAKPLKPGCCCADRSIAENPASSKVASIYLQVLLPRKEKSSTGHSQLSV